MERLKYSILATAAFFATAAGECIAQPQKPQEAAQLTELMSAKIKSMGDYEVRFTVETDNTPIEGYYAVRGDSYYLHVEGAEVYCDGRNRYEVNPENMEITVDLVGNQTDLLSNPTRAFDFLDSDFSISYAIQPLQPKNGIAELKLVPTGNNFPFGTVYVDVDTHTSLPLSICYDFDGDRIDIHIKSIRTIANPDPAMFLFDAGRYPDYAIIDFR